MKIRHGFVSNSSSSSFIVQKAALSEVQMIMIRNHVESAKFLSRLGDDAVVDSLSYHEDAWEIEENDNEISGRTSMDNFDMNWFLGQIGVPGHSVKWEDY